MCEDRSSHRAHDGAGREKRIRCRTHDPKFFAGCSEIDRLNDVAGEAATSGSIGVKRSALVSLTRASETVGSLRNFFSRRVAVVTPAK